MKLISDRKYAIVMLLFSLGYLYMSASLETDLDPVNEKYYPYMLSLAMIGLSVALLIFPSKHTTTWPGWQQIWKISFLAVVVLVYSLALAHIGFLILASVLMGVCMWLFGASRKWIVPVSIIVSVSFYLIFDRLLGLNLPAGILNF